jgi:hypothetical protein
MKWESLYRTSYCSYQPHLVCFTSAKRNTSSQNYCIDSYFSAEPNFISPSGEPNLLQVSAMFFFPSLTHFLRPMHAVNWLSLQMVSQTVLIWLCCQSRDWEMKLSDFSPFSSCTFHLSLPTLILLFFQYWNYLKIPNQVQYSTNIL